jgi:hypothetical protein
MTDLETIKKKLLLDKEKREQNTIDKFNNLKPFTRPDDIPELPTWEKEKYENVVVKNLIRCGAIPKDELEIGATYIGRCRNTEEATWTGKRFEYKRYKFGEYQDATINHFQDDNGYDLFVPLRKIDK